jgi:hypothetical protein
MSLECRQKRVGVRWTSADVDLLRQLAAANAPLHEICESLRRTRAAIYNKASELAISITPVTRRPYGSSRQVAPDTF